MTTPTSTTPKPSNSCTLTNGLTVPLPGAMNAQTGWDGSICVISGYNTSSTSSAVGYEQGLTLLQLYDGTTSVPAGKSGTLMLNLTVPGGSTQMVAYDLLVSQPNNLFPVAALGEMPDLLSGDFPAVSIPLASPADSSTGLNAFVFLQNIQAFPGSNLATAFTKALNTASASGTSTGFDATMAAYFAATSAFKDVTFTAYIAAQSYVSAFAFAWADFESTYTYYVYTTGEAAGSTATGGTVSELGTITFTRAASTKIPSLTDPSGGYTIIYTPKSGSPVALGFASGQVVLNNGNDVPQLCLQGNFMNKSYASGNQGDFGSIIPALTGTVYGQQAIATAYPQNLSSTSPSGLQTFLNSSGWQLTMGIMNVAMGIKALGEMAGWAWGKLTGTKQRNGRPEAPTAEQRAQQQNQNVEENEMQLRNANPAASVPAGDELPQQQAAVQGEVRVENDEEQIPGVQRELGSEAVQVQDQSAMQNNSADQDEVMKLRQEEKDLEQVNPSDAGAGSEIAAIQKDNEGLQAEIVREDQSLEENMSRQQQNELAADAAVEQEGMKEEQDEEEQEEREEESEKSGNDGSAEDEMEEE